MTIEVSVKPVLRRSQASPQYGILRLPLRSIIAVATVDPPPMRQAQRQNAAHDAGGAFVALRRACRVPIIFVQI